MDTMLRKTRNDRKILAGYITAFLVLFAIYLLSLAKNKQLLHLAGRVDHTYDIINRLESIGSSIKDAENGVRGYVVTRDRDFLTPYFGTEELADSIYYSLMELTQDNKLQQQRLNRLKKSIDRRFQILSFAISDFENNNRQMTDSMRHLQTETKVVMTNIRSTINQMKEDETALLAKRRKRFESSFDILNVISIVALGLSLGLAVFVVITFVRAIHDRRKGLERIKSYQEQLTSHIDELNRANNQLVRMRSQEKFAATGRIARTIAHEVRNPLTNINLATEQLKGELESSTDNSALLFEMIERNSQRINQLISDLLNSTKFSELAFQKLSVNDILDEALTGAKDRLALNNVKVVKNYLKHPCSVSVDKERMKIAFLNIIINALEAMEGKEDGQLMIETREENNRCNIRISDNGTGMDSESVSRLFEPYFTSKPKGNGLGLTNTQNIILNHKGEIIVESQPGKGTTFSIWLEFAN